MHETCAPPLFFGRKNVEELDNEEEADEQKPLLEKAVA